MSPCLAGPLVWLSARPRRTNSRWAAAPVRVAPRPSSLERFAWARVPCRQRRRTDGAAVTGTGRAHAHENGHGVAEAVAKNAAPASSSLRFGWRARVMPSARVPSDVMPLAIATLAILKHSVAARWRGGGPLRRHGLAGRRHGCTHHRSARPLDARAVGAVVEAEELDAAKGEPSATQQEPPGAAIARRDAVVALARLLNLAARG